MAPPSAPPIWPRFWVDQLANRLQFFRLLCLILAILALIGVSTSLVFASGSSTGDQRVLVSVGGVLLASLWIVAYRRGSFPAVWLPLEAALLLSVMGGLQHTFGAFGFMYLGLQFRATLGSRRDATLVAFLYAGALLAGYHLLFGALGRLGLVVVVELAAGAFNAYLMHTLAEVLSRDQERTHELRRSEDRYRTLFRAHPFPMMEFDPTTLVVLEVNDAAIELYGYTRDEFRAMTIRDFRPPEELPALDRLMPLIGSDQPGKNHGRHRKKDGTVFEVEVTSEMFDFGGRRHRVAIVVDVTEARRAERALRDSEQRFRAVAENLREALMITDLDDRIILANSRVREVLGYEPDEIIGQSATELLLASAQRDLFREKLLDRRSGKSELYEAELTRKDGRRIFAQISASPYRDTSGKVIGTLGAISDVTDLKRLEERVHQAMRIEAVGQLAGGVAHDFNNLLTVIKCHTELLEAEAFPSEGVRESIAEIARSANRGATLTQQLLAFSRKQLLRPRKIVLANVVAEAEPMLRRMVPRGVELELHRDGTAVEVFADPLQLEQVLATLVRNASEAMPTGGRITIRTQSVLLEDASVPPVATHDMPIGRYALLTVSDTGIGMSAEVVAHVFEPFFTTKEVGEGTGLGLASLYGIVRQTGGFVDLHSTPGIGTTFHIYLPVASPHDTPRYSNAVLQPA